MNMLVRNSRKLFSNCGPSLDSCGVPIKPPQPPILKQPPPPPEEDASNGSGPSEDKRKFWKNVTCYVCLPLVLITAVYVAVTREPTEPPPFIRYEHLRIRTKPFPWGDGNKSFFHNPRVNALPDGYEWSKEESPNKEVKHEEEVENDEHLEQDQV